MWDVDLVRRRVNVKKEGKEVDRWQEDNDGMQVVIGKGDVQDVRWRGEE